jgi:formiminoglutamase
MINAMAFVETDFFGIEIDLDAIPNIASSAMTLSGFSRRTKTVYFGKTKNATYIHSRRP